MNKLENKAYNPFMKKVNTNFSSNLTPTKGTGVNGHDYEVPGGNGYFAAQVSRKRNRKR